MIPSLQHYYHSINRTFHSIYQTFVNWYLCLICLYFWTGCVSCLLFVLFIPTPSTTIPITNKACRIPREVTLPVIRDIMPENMLNKKKQTNLAQCDSYLCLKWTFSLALGVVSWERISRAWRHQRRDVSTVKRCVARAQESAWYRTRGVGNYHLGCR